MKATLVPGGAATHSLRPLGLLAGLTLAGWMICALWPRLLVMMGIYNYGTFYLDSYATLAALDAMRAGLDPHVVNGFDPLLRVHVYSDWWLALRWLGLGRAHNFFVGSVWVGAFAVTAKAPTHTEPTRKLSDRPSPSPRSASHQSEYTW